ncbi:MAG: hypothetical protein KGZ67_01580 [Hydrogenophaga sp.]|jgi:hypothetical protein|nr:hypothetical protein [Hydrogenophaga sp.]
MHELPVPLWRVAHGRTGDKGNRSNISLIAWHPSFYPILEAQVGAERVREHFHARQPGRVERFALPQLHAFNFVLDDVLDGGVNDSLNLDSHGKALSFHLLAMTVRMPDHLAHLLVGPAD